MEISLKASEGELTVMKYSINYPFSVHVIYKNSNKILRTTQAVKCKNIQGSFRLFYARKIDFTEITKELKKEFDKDPTELTSQPTKTSVVHGGKVTAIPQNYILISDGWDLFSPIKDRTSFICFEKKNFLYINETNTRTYLHDKKEHFPMWLIGKIDDIKKNGKLYAGIR